MPFVCFPLNNILKRDMQLYWVLEVNIAFTTGTLVTRRIKIAPGTAYIHMLALWKIHYDLYLGYIYFSMYIIYFNKISTKTKNPKLQVTEEHTGNIFQMAKGSF